MTTNFLAPAQTQIFNHVMAWGAIRVADITCDPFTTDAGQKGTSSAPAPLPTELVSRYLDRTRQKEVSLFTPLGLDHAHLEKEVSRMDGPSLNNYIWSRNLPWMSGALSLMARTIVDDLWQIRQARLNIIERIARWKKAFGAQEKADSRPNVVGFQNHVTWLQETYAHRNFVVQQLGRKFRPGWDLVEAFYNPADRAAQNILDGGAALRKYLKVSTPG